VPPPVAMPMHVYGSPPPAAVPNFASPPPRNYAPQTGGPDPVQFPPLGSNPPADEYAPLGGEIAPSPKPRKEEPKKETAPASSFLMPSSVAAKAHR